MITVSTYVGLFVPRFALHIISVELKNSTNVKYMLKYI